jgi:hypothetical protein
MKLTLTQLTILDCVREHANQFSRHEIAKLLAGTRSTRLQHLQKNPYFGRLDKQKRRILQQDVDILVQQHFLEEDGYRKVYLGERNPFLD